MYGGEDGVSQEDRSRERARRDSIVEGKGRDASEVEITRASVVDRASGVDLSPHQPPVHRANRAMAALIHDF